MASVRCHYFFAAVLFLSFSIECCAQAASHTIWLASPAEGERIAAVENGIAQVDIKGQPPIKLTLQQWMDALKIPGLSVAVFDHGKLVWAKTYGVKEAGLKAPVTLDTLFQAGSISKPVAALAVLHYVQAGQFSRDQNINDKLISWKLPDNEFTMDQKATLRRLLSHTAGTTVHGFAGYAVGEKVPTLVQILNGEPPANNLPIRVDMIPGTQFRYSGGGTVIVQQMMIDQLKKPFPEIVREAVIKPLGLKNTTYEQPLPAIRAANAASGHRPNGKALEGKWHVYPEIAPAGLWTTASDLARIALEVSASKAGKSNKILSQGMTKQMLTPQSGPAGLGFFVNPKTDQFGHDGANEGFQANLTAFSDSGSGIAIMANSDNGMLLFNRLIESATKEYKWTGYQSQPDPPFITLLLTAELRGVPQALALYSAMRAGGPANAYNPRDLNFVGYMMLRAGDTQAALKVFEENVKIYPDDWNAFDSLAEAYMNAGRKEDAIANYEKSLRMNPKNDNAVKMLKHLGVEKN